MEKLQETKRWSELEDKIAEQEYLRSQGLTIVEVKTKPQKINYLLSKKNWLKSDLIKLKDTQLYKIMQKV